MFAKVAGAMTSSIPQPFATCQEEEWDRFVAGHPRASLYHTWRWSEFAGQVFGFPVHRLIERDAKGDVTGVLPLVMQSSVVFGRRLVSLPFFNYGGPLGSSGSVEASLLHQAAEMGRQERVKVLEIRDQVPRDGFAVRTDKATVELALPDSEEALGKALGAKLRSQIRRADREDPAVAVGGTELLGEFYPVFAATMRDLGTPVYPSRFFEQMLGTLGGDCTVVVVRLRGSAAAAAVMTHFRERTEIPWAASLHELRSTSVNMRLYWECLKFAIGRGSKVFDFGRSSVDAGTHRFKMQWGGETRPLYWVYPLETPAGDQLPASSGMREAAQAIWSKLPLGLANRLGPMISPGLPW
jgi:serine/alanine adding enzyme